MNALLLCSLALAATQTDARRGHGGEIAPLIPPPAAALARTVECASFLRLATDGEHTTAQSLALLDRAQAAAGTVTAEIETWRFWFLAMADRRDEAFRQSERMRRLGFTSGGWLYDTQYERIRKDPRWGREAAAFDRLQKARAGRLEANARGLWPARPAVALRPLTWRLGGAELYRRLASFSDYPEPLRKGDWFVDTIPYATSATDGVARQVEYTVYVPRSYRRDRPTPALMWVHGAWFRNSGPRPALSATLEREPVDDMLHAEAARRGYIEIAPLGYSAVASNVRGNARLFADILARVKRVLNVDDDRVFMAGHSNGGSSCFAAAAEDPTPFAAFYPVNGWPLPALHYANLANRRIEGLTGAADDLFLPAGVEELHRVARGAGADWNLHLVPGGGHAAGEFIGPYAVSLFDQMERIRRPALAPVKVWEADGGGPRRVDWLEILAVDESRPRASWHVPVVARDSRRTDAGEVLTDPLVQNATSGSVRATFRDNVFEIAASRVAKVRLWIHPGMVRMDRPVRVLVNGKEAFDGPVAYDPALMMNAFLDAFDRRLVWANAVDVDVPG